MASNVKIWTRVGDSDWNRMYVQCVFEGPWRDYYWQLVTGFRRQYAPKASERVQYQVLISRLATAVTMVSMLEARGGVTMVDGEPYVNLDNLSDHNRLDGVIRRCIAQLQRYTEAQKHEVTIRDDAVHQTLERVVGAVELLLKPGVEQIALLEAIISIATGEVIKAAEEQSIVEHEPRTPLLTAGEEPTDTVREPDSAGGSGYEADTDTLDVSDVTANEDTDANPD